MIGALKWLGRALGAVMVALLVGCLRAYQVVLSPHLGNCCRFEPSCSNYCITALREHGFWRGIWLGGRRLLRCRPFGASGYDPVPLRGTKLPIALCERENE